MAKVKDRKINLSDYEKTFSDEVSNTDSQYINSLERLKKIRSARENHQKRQLTRLIKQRESDDPRVLKMAERVTREAEMGVYIEVALDKNCLNREAVPNCYILRGKVRADNSKGLAGYKVQLQDAKNNVIGKAVKTDKSGNYSLIVDVKEGEKPKRLNIVVLDKQNILVQTDKLPVLVKADVVDTRDMLISSVNVVDRSSSHVILDSIVERPKKTPVRSKKTIVKKAVKSVSKKVVKKAVAKKKTLKKRPARTTPKPKSPPKKI